jgi:hypothetical protein
MNPFSDAVDALVKIAGVITNITTIPNEQREEIVDGTTDAFTLLNSVLNLILHRLDDILLTQAKEEFIHELQRLECDDDWLLLEREAHLCRSLQETRSKFDGVLSHNLLRLNKDDYRKAEILIDHVLESESELSTLIRKTMQGLIFQTRGDFNSDDEIKQVRESVHKAREVFWKERRRLLAAELCFFEIMNRFSKVV